MAVADYQQLFRQRAEKALLDGGPLTADACLQRFEERVDTVNKAILAECARWGDYRQRPGIMKADWENTIQSVRETLQVRATLLPEQLRKATRYANGTPFGGVVPAPLFNPVAMPIMHWGSAKKSEGHFKLSEGDTVYYSTDGSDPKGEDNKPKKTAHRATPSTTFKTPVLAEGGLIKAFVPQDDSLGLEWTQLEFDDSQWKSGKGGAGYDLRREYQPLLGVDLKEEMSGKLPSMYTRSTFEWNGQEAGTLSLQLKFEDGFIAYINGTKVAAMNEPRQTSSLSTARASHPDSSALRWRSFPIKDTSILMKGKNVLAIHTMNDQIRSSDLLIYPMLVMEQDLHGTAIVVEPTVAAIRARSFFGGQWSPIQFIATGSDGTQSAKKGNLTISEIMYHPSKPTEAETADGLDDPDVFEFIELMNTSESTINLKGVEFTKGIEFTFKSNFHLHADERCVLVKNRGAFEKRHGSDAKVGGNYKGSLKNKGEKLILSDADGESIVSVSYKDSSPWPESADGVGFSLVLKDPKGTHSLNLADSWQASNVMGGSPGKGDTFSVGGVVINEVLTHTDFPQVDAIELYNPTDSEIDVSGWFLTDNNKLPNKYLIIQGTKVPADGYVVIKEDNDGDLTNNADLPPELFGRAFSLSSHGEEVYLFAAKEGELSGYSHGFNFKASQNGVSFGRHINSEGKEKFPPQKHLTLGKANAGPQKPGVVISEVMYHAFDDLEEDEFVEIWNRSKVSVSLFDPQHAENTWQLDGVKFTFPAGQTLVPNEVVVICKADPASFRAKFEIPESVKVFGPLEGGLSNKGERLRLLRPDAPDVEGDETIVPMIEVDQVRFNDRDPWPEDADGSGVSLERLPDADYSDDPKSWKASAKDGGTPGVRP